MVCKHALRQTNAFLFSVISKIPKEAFIKLSSFEVGPWRKSALYSKVSKILLFLFVVLYRGHVGYSAGEPVIVASEVWPTTWGDNGTALPVADLIVTQL